MSKSQAQLIARALQAEAGCSYQAALQRVHKRRDELVARGMTPKAAYDEIMALSAADLGLKQGRA